LVAAALGVLLLAGLGTWQLQRLAWKQDLIAKVEARVASAAIDLATARRLWQDTGDIEYLRVTVSGHFAAGRDNYYFTTGPAGPGYHVYAPFRSLEGGVVLVNRGYIPDKMLPTLSGDHVPLARAGEQAGLFSGAPPPRGQNRPWLTRDLIGMETSANIEDIASPEQIVPFFIDVERDGAHPNDYPIGGTTRLDIPNRHLEYALTWYALAALLVIMTGLFLRS
jgi:surfeit locus 1 family protein